MTDIYNDSNDAFVACSVARSWTCASVCWAAWPQTNVNPSYTPDPQLQETWLGMTALQVDEIDRAEHRARHGHRDRHED